MSFGDVEVGDIGGYVEKETNLSHNGNAWIYDDAWVYDDARVSGNARIFGNARVYGNTWIFDNARVYGNAWVSGDTRVLGDAWVSGNAEVSGNASVSGDAEVSGNADYLCFEGLGSCGRNTTFFKCKDGHIHVNCGCFSGTLSEFEEKVKERHGDSKYAKEYLACIEVVKIHFELDAKENTDEHRK